MAGLTASMHHLKEGGGSAEASSIGEKELHGGTDECLKCLDNNAISGKQLIGPPLLSEWQFHLLTSDSGPGHDDEDREQLESGEVLNTLLCLTSSISNCPIYILP